MSHTTIAEGSLPTAGVTTSGGSYRATTESAAGIWLCPHVHFTQQSARSCADQHVRKMAKSYPAPSALDF